MARRGAGLVDGKAVGRRGQRSRGPVAHLAKAPSSQPLLHGLDSGPPIIVSPTPFIANVREPGWGAFLHPFLALNQVSLGALGLTPRIVSGRDGVRLELRPSLKAGAVPLKSAVTGKVAGGVVIGPRFGWIGIGKVLCATGWGSGPEFLPFSLVPGSGSEVPPWVIAGPVMERLRELLAHLRRGYVERTELLTAPRGQIQWGQYVRKQMPAGAWHQLPCRYTELDSDTRLRQVIRWALEKVCRDMGLVISDDSVGLLLLQELKQLLEIVSDVKPRRPDRHELDGRQSNQSMLSTYLQRGLQAISWVSDERGLGGGQNTDGLSWSLSLEDLWERYVESVVKRDAALSGGTVRIGRRGETVVPLPWNDPFHRPLGHLVPDFVIHRGNSVEIVDAKYKSHFADLDANRWTELAEETQSAMRADIHQVLAYAAAVGSADFVKATLVYPVRQSVYEELTLRKRTESKALIPVGSRKISLCIKAAAFG